MAGGNDAAGAMEGAERIMGIYEFRWASHSTESTPVYPSRCSHRDPTADAAIGNIIREERRKRKKPPFRRPKTGVWRADEKGEEPCGKVK